MELRPYTFRMSDERQERPRLAHGGCARRAGTGWNRRRFSSGLSTDSRSPSMNDPLAWFETGLAMTRLGMDMQVVITERLSRLARGDAAAGVEAMRMMTEKTLALGEVNARLWKAAAAGRLGAVGPEIVALYGAKVRANRKRLKR